MMVLLPMILAQPQDAAEVESDCRQLLEPLAIHLPLRLKLLELSLERSLLSGWKQERYNGFAFGIKIERFNEYRSVLKKLICKRWPIL
jgi:hypothetical protein